MEAKVKEFLDTEINLGIKEILFLPRLFKLTINKIFL